MTRKKKQRHAETEGLTPELVEHLRELDVSSVRDYFRWCKQHGFKACVDKTWHDLCLEQQFIAEQRVLEKLKRPKKYRKPKTGIVAVYEQNLKPDDVEGVVMKAIATAFEHTKARQPLLELLLYVEARAKLLHSAVYVPALCALNDQRSDWVRPLIEWTPDSYNLGRQFASLLRHLLARYAVPRFMDRAWFGDENEHRQWFIHIGNGHNIRTAQGLPVTLTKKMAHHVLQAPDDFTVQEALRWGQARALGGDERLAQTLRETRLCRDPFGNEEFELSVIRFFVENPMLDAVHFAPIIDYLWHQRYEQEQAFVARGVVEELPPAEPNLSMRGRTPSTLMRQVRAWHRQLGREQKGDTSQWLQWKRSSIHELEWVEGNRKNKNMRIWTVRELLSSEELAAEGRTMSHCVASYAHSCHAGRCAIFSMKVEAQKGRQKLLTIEVVCATKLIAQVRGKYNRLATVREKQVLSRWAAEAELKLAKYV